MIATKKREAAGWLRLSPLWIALVALPATAADDRPWENCRQDSDCRVVEGVCAQTAVNPAYLKQAKRFFQTAREHASCQQNFWKPKQLVPRCFQERCQAAAS